MWEILNISAWTHLWGWLTGSGPSGFDLDWVADDQNLGLAPLVGVALFGGPSSWSGHDVLLDSVIVGVRVVYCLMASPPDRKRVTPEGNVGSLPSSSLRLNWTCFLGYSSAGWGFYLVTLYSWTPWSWSVAPSLTYGDTVTD